MYVVGYCTTAFAFTGPATLRVEGDCDVSGIGPGRVDATQTIGPPASDGTFDIVTVATSSFGSGLSELSSTMVNKGRFIQPAGAPAPTGAVFVGGTGTLDNGTGMLRGVSGAIMVDGQAIFTTASSGLGSYGFSGRMSGCNCTPHSGREPQAE